MTRDARVFARREIIVMSTRPIVICGSLLLCLFAACSRPSGPGPALSVAHASGAATAPVAQAASTPTEPAKGQTTTVETIWKTKESLAGKTVTVTGKVVKFNGGILGVNWIHVQDGSGKAEERTHDLTVTSEDETQVGETITVTGTLGLNKDIGSGYSYPVIIERARIERARTARP